LGRHLGIRQEVIGEWRILHSGELHDVYSPSIICMIKSRQNRLAGNVAHIEVKRNACSSLVEKPEGKEPVH
jgi:hypothetical protein